MDPPGLQGSMVEEQRMRKSKSSSSRNNSSVSSRRYNGKRYRNIRAGKILKTTLPFPNVTLILLDQRRLPE